MKRLQVSEGDGVLVTFDPNVCIHSAICLKALPAVFDVSEKRWIRPELASTDEVVAAVAKCPSGALRAVRAGEARTPAPAHSLSVPEITARPNGPLLVRGSVRVIKESGDVVAKESCALCRCGATGTAPFCDGSHNRIGFRSPS
jgi:uncharacterized Fe-S cluster protein YjdI